jgi:hypothetical protein
MALGELIIMHNNPNYVFFEHIFIRNEVLSLTLIYNLYLL